MNTSSPPTPKLRADEWIGQLIEGRFEISRLLGAGSQALVFEATQHPIGRKVALKVLQPSSLQPEARASFEQRFFREAQLTSQINRASCDLILIIGDVIDAQGNEDQLRRCLQGLRATHHKLAIPGNWEYWGKVNMKRLQALYESLGIRFLNNDRFTFHWPGAPIRIVGLDDYLAGKPRYDLIQDPFDGPSLILSHCPGSADEIAPKLRSPALITSGHTHGGQVAPFGRSIITPPGSGRYVRGWYRPSGQCDLYVSVGLGNSGVPLRVGARPTVTILDIT